MSEGVMEESPHLRVAGEVRATLARRRVSARQAAIHLGWTEHYMSRRTTGKIPFDVNDLYALATVLDVPISAFFDGLEDDHSEHRRGLGLGSNKQYYLTRPDRPTPYPTCMNNSRERPLTAVFSLAA